MLFLRDFFCPDALVIVFLDIIAIIRLLRGQCKEKRERKEIKKPGCCISWEAIFRIAKRHKIVRNYLKFF